MTTQARPRPNPISAATRWQWVAAALFLLAGAVRVYRLGADPLWLDEIISTQVARSGHVIPLGYSLRQALVDIFANSLTDPHPPGYYLLLWLTSGFGAAQAEWAWRWPSALAGALSVPVFYRLARRTAGEVPAVLVAVWLAFNPTAVYFSQEARWPAVTLLLALLLTLALVRVLDQPGARRRWAVYAILAGAGLFTSYSFGLVVGVQLPFGLWAVRRQRRAWLFALALLAELALIAALGAGTLPRIAGEHAATRALNLKEIMQSLLAGDVFRYGSFWPHKLTVVGLAALAGLGAWHLWRSAAGGWRAYPTLQVAAPLAAYGLVLSPFFHVNLPNYETRQFLVLLPALCLLFAHGLAQMWAWLPRPAAWSAGLALSAVVVVGSVQGLARYWTITRSPEGQAVRYVASQLAPGDAIVALDYFSRAALRYYLPDPPAYGKAELTPAGLRLFQPVLTDVIDETLLNGMPLAEVQAHPRLWVLSVPGGQDEYLPLILAGCQVQATTDFGFLPMRVQLVSGCGAAMTP